jgi:solute carrier family 25 phosphate transporter 23/24/25/41
LKTDGIPGFYRGIVPSLAKVLPASSISYAVYDILSTGKSREE